MLKKIKELDRRILNNIFVIIGSLLLLLIFLTPTLTREGMTSLEDDTLETLIILVAYGIAILIFESYRSQIQKNEQELMNAWKHIGKVNLRIERYKSLCLDLEKYPQNQRDLKYLLQITAEKILGLVSNNRVMIRIIESDTLKTLSEHHHFRGNVRGDEIQIGNREIVESTGSDNFEIINSKTENLRIIASAVFPKKEKMSEEQRLFVEKMINDLANYYLIFSSAYYVDNS